MRARSSLALSGRDVFRRAAVRFRSRSSLSIFRVATPTFASLVAVPCGLAGSRYPAGCHREAMSFSTRSSWDLNGSLHSTVRCDWSLSFRCTQSTV